MRNSVLALLTAVSTAAYAYVSGYHVEPVKAAWSGWTRTIPGQDTVSQLVTCNFDSLSYVELFAGEKGNGGAYTATVLDGNTVLMQSVGYQDLDCRWVKFDQWLDTVAFTKGKVYEVRFTRSGAGSAIWEKRGTLPIFLDSPPPMPRLGACPG